MVVSLGSCDKNASNNMRVSSQQNKGKQRKAEGVSALPKGLNLEPWRRPTYRGNLSEAVMSHWRNMMVDRPETDGAVYVKGWTISGLAVLAAVVAVWVFGI